MTDEELIQLDMRHVWHPCSQMKDYEAFPPIPIGAAEGPYLITRDGRKIIDAISSWWCKSLGHRHPRILAAVKRQLDRFEHVIMANTCCETVARLSAKLTVLRPSLDRVFYADNGSTAVEIALKMSLQAHAQSGRSERRRFASLERGYHGETILTLGAGDCDLYSKPFAHLLPKFVKLDPSPYVSGELDPNWEAIPEERWNELRVQLDAVADELAAIVFEPVVQGAAGIKIYSPDLLRRLRRWADVNDVYLIADEIMTGFGRTGSALACDHTGITPDFLVLSKQLTAGWGPMSVVLCSSETYDLFYDDYLSGRGFMHSNTYAGYAVTATAALEALSIYEEEDVFAAVARRSEGLRGRLERVAAETGALTNIRSIGFVAAADLIDPSVGEPFSSERRMGFECYKKAVELGALLRPQGDVIYYLPPLNAADAVLDDLAEITISAINQTIKGNGTGR